MKVKRLMASVSAGFDDFVTRVENHEAAADCAIDELRKAAARVRVQQARTATHLERRLADAQLKRTALSSRAARARTLRRVERCGPEESLEAVFDRWDTVVTADEYRDGVEPVDGADLVDALDREFADEEDLAELRGDLAALRARARSEDGDEGGAER